MMFNHTETQNTNNQTDNDHQLLNKKQLILSDNVDISNINNSLCNELKEIGPTTQYINETIFEEDLSIIIDELVNLNFIDINIGKEKDIRKQNIFDYINDHKIMLQEIYIWLSKNQTSSNSIYLLGYFNYYGIGTEVN